MAKDILATSPGARAVFERVDAALGEPLSALILGGPEEQLTLTTNAQPALVAASTAVLAAIHERVPGLPPPAFAGGHSLGEYSALVAASALSLDDAVRLVRARGRAMQDAVPPGTGAMAAIVGMDPGRVEALCVEAARGDVVAPANYNAPGQIVIAGHAGAVARAAALVVAAKGRVIPLNVSAPFHCSLMAPAASILERHLAVVTIENPRFPIVANFDARPNSAAARVRELLVRQVDGAVLWEASIRYMVASGVTRALEIGPGKVLAGLVKRIAKNVPVLSVGDVASLELVSEFLAGDPSGS